MSELWVDKVERAAAEKVAAALALREPEYVEELGDVETFDPWELLPVYGSYDSDFGACVLDVLRELQTGSKARSDLAAEMVREMLCWANLCTYGTSPRVCFPTSNFRPLLPELIAKWERFHRLSWSA